MAHVRRKGLRLFGHPVHPMLTDFPIALWATSLLWDVLGLGFASPLWWAIGFWSVAVGLAMALLVAVTGFVDYVGLPSGDPAEASATRHLVVMLSATTSFLGSLLAQGGPATPVGPRLFITLALAVLGTVLLLLGGWLGGALVFRYGVGGDHVDAASIDDQSVGHRLQEADLPPTIGRLTRTPDQDAPRRGNRN